MPGLSLEHLEKTYPGGTRAVDDLSLEAPEGTLFVLVGPSGCGKTTTLRLIAGLERADGGTIRLGDRVIDRLAPRERDVAMVFQHHALYPRKTVRQNMAFALRLRGMARAEIQRRIDESATMLGLTELLDRRPGTLSGGQRQRAALGRALVRRPAVFLLDEPLSDLDAGLRVDIRRQIKRLHAQLSATMLYVTHDQSEATALADRLAVLRNGRIEQVGTPEELYLRPTTRFVAGFLGSPPMNLLDGRLDHHDGASWCFTPTVSSGGVDTSDETLTLGEPAKLDIRKSDQPVTLGFRPEAVRLLGAEEGDGGDERGIRASARVEMVELVGADAFVYLDWGGACLVARVSRQRRPAPGEVVRWSVAREGLHWFDEG